jgi:hypothetical protein
MSNIGRGLNSGYYLMEDCCVEKSGNRDCGREDGSSFG